MTTASTAKLQPVFVDLVERFQSVAAQNAKAAFLEEQRAWSLPAPRDWTGDPHDIAGMTGAFDRTDINTNYQECYEHQPPGSTADTIAVKTQLEYVAGAERAFRTRHCSPVRAALHAAARLQGHGHGQGVFLGGVARYIKDMINYGGGDVG